MSRLPLKTQRQILALREQNGWGRKAVADELGVTEKQVRGVFEKHDGQPTGITVPFRVLVWDLETSDFKSDIGVLGVAAFLDLATGKVVAKNWNDFDGTTEEQELGLARWTAGMYASASALVGHNSLGFDAAFLRGVLQRHGEPPLPKRIHFDTMQTAMHGGKWRCGYSLENLLDFFGLPLAKDHPSKHDWRRYIAGDPEARERITTRCVEDVKGQALLWGRLEATFMDWKGR